jgi:hypothetical protein
MSKLIIPTVSTMTFIAVALGSGSALNGMIAGGVCAAVMIGGHIAAGTWRRPPEPLDLVRASICPNCGASPLYLKLTEERKVTLYCGACRSDFRAVLSDLGEAERLIP